MKHYLSQSLLATLKKIHDFRGKTMAHSFGLYRRVHAIKGIVALCILFVGCQIDGEFPQDRKLKTEGMITQLGADTLIGESLTWFEDKLSVTVARLSPAATYLTYTLAFNEQFDITAYEEQMMNLKVGPPYQDVLKTTTWKLGMDTMHIITDTGRRHFEEQIRHFGVVPLPLLDKVHWPFAFVGRKMTALGIDTLTQPMLLGRHTMDFFFSKVSTDSMLIRHPRSGVIEVLLGEGGGIQSLNASQTTQKLQTNQVNDVNTTAMATYFNQIENEGVGPLSGRGQISQTIDDALIVIDYGQPMRRGRTIFGNVVKYGEVWRTGANLATHFSTSKRLRFGDFILPPGTYTVFTVPEKDQGRLLFNRQTGINGNAYDSSNDLGNVPLRTRNFSAPVDQMTIHIREEHQLGILEISWGWKQYAAVFEVLK